MLLWQKTTAQSCFFAVEEATTRVLAEEDGTDHSPAEGDTAAHCSRVQRDGMGSAWRGKLLKHSRFFASKRLSCF